MHRVTLAFLVPGRVPTGLFHAITSICKIAMLVRQVIFRHDTKNHQNLVDCTKQPHEHALARFQKHHHHPDTPIAWNPMVSTYVPGLRMNQSALASYMKFVMLNTLFVPTSDVW